MSSVKKIRDRKEKEKEFGNMNRECDATSSSKSCRVWSSGVRDPRIVRVSKTLGGKDRHSKVRTIRGLRDRRVRLSVPTAIQLYDLQDRLGLNQPSKVVDWLLNAAQHEINKLPPLHFPLDNFIHHHFHQSSDHQSSKAKDERLNFEGERQLEIATTAASMYPSPSHQDDHNLLYINSRGGGGDQASSLIGNRGFPHASYQYYWPDQSNKTYFSQFGFISSQLDVAPSSLYASDYMTTVSSELDGISAHDQNLPFNSSPKARPF